MDRRDFFRTASLAATGAALMPRTALANVTPPDEPDTADIIQTKLDRGEDVEIIDETITLRRRLDLGGRGRLLMHRSHVTCTGNGALRVLPNANGHTITYCFFESRPTLLQRVINRFGSGAACLTV